MTDLFALLRTEACQDHGLQHGFALARAVFQQDSQNSDGASKQETSAHGRHCPVFPSVATAWFDHEYMEAPHFRGHEQRFYQTHGLSSTLTGVPWVEKQREMNHKSGTQIINFLGPKRFTQDARDTSSQCTSKGNLHPFHLHKSPTVSRS